MCSGPKTELSPCDMDAGPHQGKEANSLKTCSKLLELAATDDLPTFIHEVEDRGCNVDESSFWYGRSFGSKKMGVEERTPIMVASLYGSTRVLDYIVRTGKVDVNRACGSDGATALHCAAAGGSFSCVEVVEILLGASSDVNTLDASGKKPGDLIPPCVKSSACSRKKALEMLLNGVCYVGDCAGEEGNTKEGSEKREYPVDVSLPDINNGVYGTDEFRMYSFKVKPCSRAYSHDWTECPFAHPGENAKRRDPRKYHYTCVPCPEFKKGNCPKGDACEYAHGVFESWLHPAQYRTRLCKDETGCSRKVCFFAHKPEELRPLYASTGSGMPSPKSASVGSLDMSHLSPLSFGTPSLMVPNCSNPPMSPIACSSPMSSGGGNSWQNKVSLVPPALQLPASRLKTSLSARDVDSDMNLLGLEKIRTQQMIEEMASLSSPYNRAADLKPMNLDDVFGSLDPSLISQLQGLSPKVSAHLQSPNGRQIRQSMNQLRASYPANVSSSPVRKSAPYGFDSSAAVAQAVMNSRSSAFAKRSQSFVDRSGGNYRSALSGPVSSSPSLMPSKFSEWGSPDGRVDWGFNGSDDANRLRKSASFGIRSGNDTKLPSMEADEPDVSWVSSLVRDGPFGNNNGDEHHWFDQMYIEQEQIVA